MSVCGTGKDHCCWVAGQVCPHVRPSDREGYLWDCGLRADLGSWEAVHSSEEYLCDVKPTWLRIGMKEDCGDWEPTHRGCPDCGKGV